MRTEINKIDGQYLINRSKKLLAGRAAMSPVPIAGDAVLDPDQSGRQEGERYLSIAELALNDDQINRGEFDLLGVFTFDWGEPAPQGLPPVVFIDEETLRGAAKPGGPGLMISDVAVCNFDHSCRYLSFICYKIPRTGRTQRLLQQIENQSASLDFAADYRGSLSLADALMDQIELLANGFDASVVAAFEYHFTTTPSDTAPTRYIAFLGPEDTGGSAGRWWIKNRQLHRGLTGADTSAVVRQDLVLLRIGDKPDRENLIRYINELRKRHALKASDADPQAKSESYLHFLERDMKERHQKLVNQIYAHHKMLPMVTPLAVEIAADLIPHITLEKDQDTRFQLLLNQVRDDFRKVYGVKVPGLRLRGNETDMPPGSYLIMINEIPLVMGTLALDKGFCNATPVELRAFNIKAEAAVNPDNGMEASWIYREDWEQVEKSGYMVLDFMEYLILHLGGVIRKNLSEFTGIQEVRDLLETTAPALLQPVSEARGGIPRFASCLNTLLNEELPVNSLNILATKYLNVIAEPAYIITEKLREAAPIQNHLIREQSNWKVFTLGPQLSSLIAGNIISNGDAAVLALLPERTQEALSAVRAALQTGSRQLYRPVLLVEDPGIRMFVKKLIELEFPHVKVITRKEAEAVDPKYLKDATEITMN